MNQFVLQWPWMLAFLLLAFPLAWLFRRARRKRAALIASLNGESAKERSRGRDRLRLAALCFLVVGLSRPGFDPERRSLSQSGRDVLFAIDVSRSMLAEDAQPSRLETAKQGVRDALERFQTERVGVIIYAGSASILCPLTHDYSFVRYMLDQATPRSVEFGGTTLLSAVEKSVDNIFADDREGMQDIVVLTDGEDHGPDMSRVADLLKASGVDMLLVGLGDAKSGSRIPIELEEGELSYLKDGEQFVHTKRNDDSLQDLAKGMKGTSYVVPGTAAFDLGELYAEYALEKPVSGSLGEESYVVYREAGIFFVFIGFALLLVADRFWRGLGFAMVMIGGCNVSTTLEASPLSDEFEKGRQLQISENLDGALEVYGELELAMKQQPDVTLQQGAALQLNIGLCYLSLAKSAASENSESALSEALQAQRYFLKAKRMNPELSRAGQRLDATSKLIIEYKAAALDQEKKENEINGQMGALLERLEALLESQARLKDDVFEKDPQAKRRRPSKGNSVAESPVAQYDATEDCATFSHRQSRLRAEGIAIEVEMKQIDEALTRPLAGDDLPMQSLMQTPLELMADASGAMSDASSSLGVLNTWKTARAFQEVAIKRIEEILEMLASSDSSESEGEESDEYDDEWGWDDYDESSESMSSSMSMEGDMAAGSEMKPLPVPNYSTEEVLMDESANLQFRQQQRSKANAGKVKKDW